MPAMNLSALLLRWRGVDPKRRRAGQGGAGRFTQAAAADKLNTHLKTYQDWEQGRKQPRGAALAYVLQSIKKISAPSGSLAPGGAGGSKLSRQKDAGRRAVERNQEATRTTPARATGKKEKPHARKKRKSAR